MRYGICNELFEGWEFERVCQTCAQLGYEGLELAPFTLAASVHELDAAARRTLRASADRHSIALLGLHWLLARTEGMHITSADAAARRRASDYLVALLELCRDLGGELVVFGSPKQRSLLPATTAAQALERAATVFRSIMPAAERCGVRVCIEPLAPSETDFLNTCADAMELVERVAHPLCLLHLDVKAMSSEAAPIAEVVRRHAADAGHFHANDANLRGPGFGDVDFVPIFAALAASPYRGWVSVEVFDFQPDPVTIARESIAYMKKAAAAAAAAAPS